MTKIDPDACKTNVDADFSLFCGLVLFSIIWHRKSKQFWNRIFLWNEEFAQQDLRKEDVVMVYDIDYLQHLLSYTFWVDSRELWDWCIIKWFPAENAEH